MATAEHAAVLPADEEIPSPEAGLGRRAARGAGVTLAGQGLRIVLQLGSVVVLARLLSPHDYGLLAVVLVVIGVGEIFRDLGLSAAAIRAPELSRAQRDGLFWCNTAAGIVLALLTALAAGPIAALFGQPELVAITQVLALTFVVNGLATQYRADLTRSLRFGALVVTDVTGQFAGLVVAVTAAVLGAGYWALVAQQLTQVTVVLVAAAGAARWLPRAPRRGAGLGPFLRLGGSLMGTQLVHYASNNLDTLVLGLRAGPASLGLYNRAFQLVMTPLNQLRSPATTVALPVLARLQSDLPRSGEYLKRSQLAMGYSLIAGMALAAGCAVPLVELMLGSRWTEVAPVFALLAIAGSAQTLSYVGYWVYLSRGLGGQLFRYTLLTLVLKAVSIGIGSTWGVVGVAAGYCAAALLEWPLSLWWLSRITPIPRRDLLLGAARVTACAALAGSAAAVVARATEALPVVATLALGLVAGLAGYGLTALVPQVRADLAGVLAWGRRMVARRG